MNCYRERRPAIFREGESAGADCGGGRGGYKFLQEKKTTKNNVYFFMPRTSQFYKIEEEERERY